MVNGFNSVLSCYSFSPHVNDIENYWQINTSNRLNNCNTIRLNLLIERYKAYQKRKRLYNQSDNEVWLLHSFPIPVCLSCLSGMQSFEIRSEEHTSELQSRENLVCRL